LNVVELGAGPVGLGTLLALVDGDGRVALAPAAVERLRAARAIVERYAAGDEPIYGLNTGLGGNLRHRIPAAEIEAFQATLIRGRCIGVGEPFPERVCRAVLLCRIVGMARGGSGVSPAVLDLMIGLFNAGLAPVIPGRGSIGAADLGLCAHLGAALIGLGEIYSAGRRLPAAEALAGAGLAPARLGPKDGLAILNASAVVGGHGSLVLAELGDLLAASMAVAALSGEGYAANPTIFDPRLAEARPARGQVRAARAFRNLLAGSYLHEPGAPRSIQDALSFRVLSQVYGPALASFATAAESVATEVNAAADSPLVLVEDGVMLSTANFHTPDIALNLDALAIVGAGIATASVQRAIKLMNPALSGLQKYLSPVGGASTGYNSMQKTLAALHAEIRLKAVPASLDAVPVSETVEDHAPHTPLAVRKLEEQAGLLRLVVAIEALVAAQAVDLRGGPRLAPTTAALHAAIRERIPPLGEDRANGPDADRVAALLRDPALLRRLREGLGDDGVFGLG
jgi:histidine ammonia-lyase